MFRALAKVIIKDDTEYYLFKLRQLVNVDEIQNRLAEHGWQLHYKGYVHEGQVCQWRKVVNGGKYEYHIRLYEDGTVTGHFSLTPEKGFIRHLFAIGSRSMTKEEANELMSQLGVSGESGLGG